MGISREELLKQTEGMTAQELTELGDALHALANRNNGTIRRRITELEGLGKEAWEGVDVVEYLEQERDSWER